MIKKFMNDAFANFAEQAKQQAAAKLSAVPKTTAFCLNTEVEVHKKVFIGWAEVIDDKQCLIYEQDGNLVIKTYDKDSRILAEEPISGLTYKIPSNSRDVQLFSGKTRYTIGDATTVLGYLDDENFQPSRVPSDSIIQTLQEHGAQPYNQ